MTPRCGIGLLLFALLVSGCADLQPGIYDPDLDDAQLSIAVLKSQNREALRLIADLRAELEASRETLSASRVAHARMQGQLREVEHRYTESRQIVELQREELSRLRDERDEVLRTGREIRTQMSQLQRQLAALPQFGKSRKSRPQRIGRTTEMASRARTSLISESEVDEVMGEPLLNGEGPGPLLDSVAVAVVQRGDTLWGIARRYRVNFVELRELNGLGDNPHLIYPGQELLLPPE